jgi:UDP-N-acetylmuramate--alanine ligase
MESRGGVAIAGTHGKSTTTAMVGEILIAAGLDPTVLCGAADLEGKSGGRLGRGRWLLAEACEYRANFRHLEPQIATILGIEPDHFDCFASPRELEAAFAEFAAAVPPDGLVLAREDCAATRRAIEQIECASETFGFGAAAVWRATELRERRGLYSMTIRCRGRLVCNVKLRVGGRHNVLNSLAAAAVAKHCGATATAIRAGLERFAGLKRRLERIGEHNDIAILDDYAHHPTEVAASLAALRQLYPGRPVVCVFQPHQVSRTRHLLNEFARSLQNADRIVLAEIFRAREEQEPAGDVTSGALAQQIAALGTEVLPLASLVEIHDHLKQSLRPLDVVVTMGAGDIGRVAHELDHGFRTFRKAG